MQIRQDQVSALEQVRMPDFENHMVEHLKEFTPLHSKSLGEPGIRQLIQEGMKRAKSVGFNSRGPAQFYIETCVLLGIDFDTDPQYPDLGNILRDTAVRDEMRRADTAYAWLMKYLQAAGGPNRQFAKEALRRARQIPYPYTRTSSFREDAVRLMKQNHPEKIAYLGQGILEGLLARAVEEARRYSIATETGVALLLAMMFAVGHGVAVDPKYPWVAHTLTNPAIAPDRRVDRLYSKTMTYLDYVLEHLESQ